MKTRPSSHRYAMLVATALVTIAATGSARAAVVVEHGGCSGSVTFGPVGEGAQTFTTRCDVALPKFDPSLGVLVDVTAKILASFDISATGHNPTGEDQVFTTQIFGYYMGVFSDDPGFSDATAIYDSIPGGPLIAGAGNFPGGPFNGQTFVSGAATDPALGFGAGGSIDGGTIFLGSRRNDFVGPGAISLHWDTGIAYDYVFSDPALSYSVTTNHAMGIDIFYTYLTPGEAGVPEAATWAMMILGFGLVGATLRRRSPQRAEA